MGDLASKIRAKFTRRSSATPSIASSTKSDRVGSPGRTRSLNSQRGPPSFVELPSSRSNTTDDHGSDCNVLSSMILDKEPAGQPAANSSFSNATSSSSSPLPSAEPTNCAPAKDAKVAAPTFLDCDPRTAPSTNQVGPDVTATNSNNNPNEQQEGESNQSPQQGSPSPVVHAVPSAENPSSVSPASAGSAVARSGPAEFSACGSTVGDQQGTRDKMGKDLQPTLPSINEHPSSSTDSAAATTDEDETVLSSPLSAGPDSDTPTPRATGGFSNSSASTLGPGNAQSQALRASSSPAPALSHIHASATRQPQNPNSAGPTTTTTTTTTTAPSSPIAARRLASSTGNSARPTTSTHSYSPATTAALPNLQTAQLIRTLLGATNPDDLQNLDPDQLLPVTTAMVNRKKIWVRRPGASATLVTINEDDVVDDVRDMILRKYANSLGRQFDAPDLTLRIVPREQQRERTLGPDEHMIKTLEAYFPGGQTVEEALIIDVPLRRTPRPSPRAGPPHAPQLASVYFAPATEDARPPETGTDYFGPAVLAATTHLANGTGHPHSINVLTTGQIPQIPSPGGTRTRAYRERPERPRLGRQHTSSPTILNLVSASHVAQLAANANLDQTGPPPPAAPPMPTPPPAEATMQRVATPPPGVPARVASPRPPAPRPKKSKKTIDHPSLPPGVLSGGVPPINVLIVEDNPINLRLLEVFVKRLKVRWQTAVNGREAVDKWRQGGFHLVLMDIQLPVMSGLDATREIRRLERVNSIGVFSSSASSAPEEVNGDPSEEDKLVNTDMFKSPVIIVALTASSLQSDRHEALAAGCNDFLTKPVNFVWFEKKIMEWGCMQALIDFDGWRKWKDFSQKGEDPEAAAKKAASAKTKSKKNRSSLTTTTTGTSVSSSAAA